MLLVGALVVFVLVEAVWLSLNVIGPDPIWDFGMDYRYYASLGQTFVDTGTFYLPHQFAPHETGLLGLSEPVDTLYPPNALLLFVPFAYLPSILWWAIPIAVTGYALYRLRPAPWAWAVMLTMLLWPRAIGAYLFGNTDIWMMAAIAGGLVWGWPALAVTMKPTLLPFALIGIRKRSWWLCAGLGLVFVVLTLPMWLDYVTVMGYVTGIDLGYNRSCVSRWSLVSEHREEDGRRGGLRVVHQPVPLCRRQGHERSSAHLPKVADGGEVRADGRPFGRGQGQRGIQRGHETVVGRLLLAGEDRIELDDRPGDRVQVGSGRLADVRRGELHETEGGIVGRQSHVKRIQSLTSSAACPLVWPSRT
jgi:hypothetical protein